MLALLNVARKLGPDLVGDELNIAIDGRVLSLKKMRGVSKVTLYLCQYLATLKPQWKFYILLDHVNPDLKFRFKEYSNVKIYVLPSPTQCGLWRFPIWDYFFLPLMAKLLRANLIFYPVHYLCAQPISWGLPKVCTIHDLIPCNELALANTEKFEDYQMARSEKEGLKSRAANLVKITRHFLKTSEIAVVPSQYVKNQLISDFRFFESAIEFVHWANNPNFTKISDIHLIATKKRQYGITPSGEYILAFGELGARKNVQGMICAWTKLSLSIRRRCSLLIVGISDSLCPHLREMIADCDVKNSCFLYPYIPEADLPVLMSGALALCYPSFDEGFGLPILDAFKCETPVIISNCASMPEVAGDAALYVDPYSTDDIARQMKEMIENPSLRHDLIVKGKKRLELFSWTKTAEKYAEVFMRSTKNQN